MRPPRASCLLILGLALGLSADPARAATTAIEGWSLVGPSGGRIESVLVSGPPGTIVATTFELFFHTSDAGLHWNGSRSFDPSSGNFGVTPLAVDPRDARLVYGVGASSLLSSPDGGATWNEVKSFPASASSMAIDPQDPQTLYVGTGSGGFRRRDGQWLEMQGLAALFVSHLLVDPQDSKTLYAGCFLPRHVFKSQDRGDTWIETDSGLSTEYLFSLARDPARPGALYAGTDTGLYESTDGAQSWHRVGRGLPAGVILSLAVDQQGSGEAYVM